MTLFFGIWPNIKRNVKIFCLHEKEVLDIPLVSATVFTRCRPISPSGSSTESPDNLVGFATTDLWWPRSYTASSRALTAISHQKFSRNWAD